jgi:hypothetical protein
VIIELTQQNGGCLPQDLNTKGFTPDEVAAQWHMAQSLAEVKLKLMGESSVTPKLLFLHAPDNTSARNSPSACAGIPANIRSGCARATGSRNAHIKNIRTRNARAKTIACFGCRFSASFCAGHGTRSGVMT